MTSPAVDLFDQFWCWRLRRTPEFATFVGVKDYNSVLESVTEERFREDFQTCSAFLEKAKVLLESSTEPSDRENLEFFISEVSTFTEGYQHGGFYFPLNYMEGLHVDSAAVVAVAALLLPQGSMRLPGSSEHACTSPHGPSRRRQVHSSTRSVWLPGPSVHACTSPHRLSRRRLVPRC